MLMIRYKRNCSRNFITCSRNSIGRHLSTVAWLGSETEMYNHNLLERPRWNPRGQSKEQPVVDKQLHQGSALLNRGRMIRYKVTECSSFAGKLFFQMFMFCRQNYCQTTHSNVHVLQAKLIPHYEFGCSCFAGKTNGKLVHILPAKLMPDYSFIYSYYLEAVDFHNRKQNPILFKHLLWRVQYNCYSSQMFTYIGHWNETYFGLLMFQKPLYLHHPVTISPLTMMASMVIIEI